MNSFSVCNLATRVIFLLNTTKVGEYACYYAENLVVVDIPEGIERIGYETFSRCINLTAVSFPATLTLIGDGAFFLCSSLEIVDLRHTNLQEIEYSAFYGCSELKSMTIPDALQTLGRMVYKECSKLIPSGIYLPYNCDDNAIIAYLGSQQNTVSI